ncbi:trigger factor [Lachnospiraceae bacterium MD335]|nr:trigger factor [Lachnospiraceae bacterium MD335]
MKNKWIIACLLGVMVFGSTGCQDKTASDNTSGTQTASEAGAAAETESAGQAQMDGNVSSSIADVQRVSERVDYIGLQDLDIDKYVTLNDYKNMKVEVYKPQIQDQDIEQYIDSELLKGYIKDRAVADGDVANIDYEGKKDGVAFEGGTASGFDLEIGSGSFIPGFEEKLIGVMPGETVDLDLTFPEGYREPSFAGQPVVFTVTVNGIAESISYADATDADLARLGLSYESKEALWDAAKAEVEKSAEEAFEASKTSAILNQILSESTIKEIPEYLVEEQMQGFEIYMESMSQMYYGMNFEKYLQDVEQRSLEDFEAEIRPDCETTVKQYLISEALARAEKLDITDELVREYAAEDIAGYDGYTVDSYLEEVGYTTYRMFVLQEKLVERLNGIITVETTSEP